MVETGTAPEARVFHTLDALRGVAAIGVVLFHMAQLFTPLAAPGGYLAVDLFFIMSGVVLSYAYEARFLAGMGTVDFMRARLIRLYPLYLLGTLFGLTVTLASMHGRNINSWDTWSLSRAASFAFLFLPNFSTRPVNELFPLNIPCWSLFFEILVNLLFVISWPLLTARRLVAISVVAGAAVGLTICLEGNIDQGYTASSFAFGLARTVFGFSVGVLIARQVARKHRGESNLGVLGILAVVGIAIAGRPQGELRAIWDAVCVLAVFPLAVYCGTLIDPAPRLRRIATFLGVTSYAVYVLHSPLAGILNSATRHAAAGTGAPFTGFAVLIALLIGCSLIDRFIDIPARSRLGSLVPKMKALR